MAEMTELDKIRAEIEGRLENARGRQRSAGLDCEVALAELVAHDRAVAAMGAPAAPVPAATRHPIQRPVMALFDSGLEAWTVNDIIKGAGLPEAAVRKFLARAVKSGLLSFGGGLYRLPPAKLDEAAK